MAFIDKKDPVVINIKLTTKGRELLSTGALTFKYFAIGDSEIDYEFNEETGHLPVDSIMLRPADKNPKLLSFITRNITGGTEYEYNEISSIPASEYIVTNTVEPIGFFSITSGGTATFLTDANHVKQPDAMVDVTTVNGGKSLTLMRAPTYGASGEEPAIGDLLLIKWTYDSDTTGHTITKTKPTPFLLYKILDKISGSLGGDDLVIEVDRDLPDFSGIAIGTPKAGAMIYYNFINFSGDTVFNMSATEYLDESVLAFLQNSQCPTIVFPFWNMSIVYTEEIAGVGLNNFKYSQFKTKPFGGFVSYIQNQAPTYKKLGIIHYTNSSPANVYGEEFFVNTPEGNVPKLQIPTIMWHKAVTNTLGVTLVATGSSKLLTGTNKSLDTKYYDLSDLSGNIVGKVFYELKIFVIEDQELLFAMSYKSNRNWTLPDYMVGTTETPCP